MPSYSTPLKHIVTGDTGRVNQLSNAPGMGNQQPARVCDVNPMIDYLNNRSSINKGTVTQGTSITTGVTLNAVAGTITTVSSTLAADTTATFTVTNSEVTASSIILASLSYPTTATGEPVIDRIVPASGSFTITIRNVSAAAALNDVMAISFVVL